MSRVFLIALLTMGVAVACSDSDKSRGGTLRAAEITELHDSFLQSSFAATYRVQTAESEGDDGALELAIAKVGSTMLIELNELNDHEFDEHAFFRMNVETGVDEVECVLRTLRSDEQVCYGGEDRAWTIVLLPWIPVVAFLDGPDSLEWTVEVTRSGRKSIAGLDADCYDLAQGEDPPVEFCLGPDGEALYQSWDFDGSRVALTALDVRAEVRDTDVEIPYRVVYEEDLSADECQQLGLPCYHLP